MLHNRTNRFHKREISLRVNANKFGVIFRVPIETTTKEGLFDFFVDLKDDPHLPLVFEHRTLFSHQIEACGCLPSSSRRSIIHLKTGKPPTDCRSLPNVVWIATP